MGNLFSINLATGAGAFIGTEFNFPLSTEIEYDTNTGTLYSDEVNGNVNLHTINPATGLSTGFVPHVCCALNGMEFVGNTLYATNNTGGTGELVTVNPVTGALTLIGAPNGIGSPVQGLAYHATTATMFGVSGLVPGGPSNLITINLLTGVATPLAPIIDAVTGAQLDRIGSIEFGADGVLYGGMGLNATINPGWLISINPMNGMSNFIGPTGFAGITGLTETATVGVPEPGTLALFGLGLVGLGFARRRKAS